MCLKEQVILSRSVTIICQAESYWLLMVITSLRNPSLGSEFQITALPGFLAEVITGTEGREGWGSRPFLWEAAAEMDEITVFNQILHLPDRNHPAMQSVQEQEQRILNTLPAVHLSVTN